MDNLVNSLVNKSVGKLTNQLIIDGLKANPNMSQQQLSQTLGVSMQEIAGALNEDVKKSGYQTTTIPNMETGQAVSEIRDIGGGFQAYQDENGQTSGFSRVDPSRPKMIQLYGPNGEYRGEQKITSTTQDMLRTLGPIALAAGASALAGSLGAGGTGSTFAGEALADANLLSGGTNLSSLTSTGAPFAGEALADASLLSNANGTALNTLASGKSAADLAALDIATGGAGGTAGAEAFANATATGANVPTLTNLTGGSGAFTGAAGGITADSVAQKLAADAVTNSVVPPTNIPKTLIDPITGLVTSAAGNVLANRANQEGITDARNLINEYGKQADIRLTNAYTNAQNLGTAGRTDLGNIFSNQNTNLNNIINAQAGVYGDTNTALGNIYSNTGTNLQNLYNQQVGYQEPYQDIGRAGSKGLLANQDYLTKQFGTADLYSGLAPNYQFMLGQGQMANQRAGNMSGGALGGNALQGLQKYTQDYAGNAYQQAFNNFQGQRQNIYNTLSGMANIGQTSTGQLVNLGNAYGSNMTGLSNNYAANRLANAGQMQNAYNQYGGNLTNAANTYGSNLTSNYNTGVNAANVAGLNAANLAVGVGGALASNATAAGANNATALSNLGNTALLGSMIKAT